jgi:hypothetical protein
MAGGGYGSGRAGLVGQPSRDNIARSASIPAFPAARARHRWQVDRRSRTLLPRWPRPFAPKPNDWTLQRQCDWGVEVGQVESESRQGHCQPAGRIEAKEPDPGQAASGDVGTDVDFREAGNRVKRWNPSGSRLTGLKRHDPNPGPALELLDFESGWNQMTNCAGLLRPVGKKQIGPAH